MSIAQIVYDVCELSRATKIPFLLISNPGAGKTTGIRRFAEANGYHLEVVIGSRSTPEELLGYQVNNGGTSLEHLDSQWWARIVDYDKKGIPSILFCDEISTCPGQTEGSMLSLIQDRENQKGEKLPESCIVLGAANYSKNLPSYMDIITPAINRFCVINLMDGMNGLDLVNELFHPEQNIAQSRTRMPFTDKESSEYMSTMEKFFQNIFIEYSDRKSSKGIIDICNTEIASLYQDADRALYNVISLRSMSEFTLLVKYALEFGMSKNKMLYKIADGMIGAGSCSFNDTKQGEAYRSQLHASMDSLAQRFMKIPQAKALRKQFDYGEKNIANLISNLNMVSQEVGSFIKTTEDDNQIETLKLAINDAYGDLGTTIFGMNDNKEKQIAFLSDYEAVGEFFDENEEKLSSQDAHDIAIFLQKYSPYYAQLGKGRFITDVNKMRVFKNYKSSLYMCSLLALKTQDIPNEFNMDMVKNEDVIEVGIRRITEKTPYKIPYNTSVSANTLGIPAGNVYPLVFEHGKLIAINVLDLKNL